MSKISKRVVTNIPTYEYREIGNEVQNHYVVEFLAPYGIGLKLTLTKESELLVSGFNRVDNDERIGPSEACGSIHIGDILAGVNDIILYELDPSEFANRVSKYDHDKEKPIRLLLRYGDTYNDYLSKKSPSSNQDCTDDPDGAWSLVNTTNQTIEKAATSYLRPTELNTEMYSSKSKQTVNSSIAEILQQFHRQRHPFPSMATTISSCRHSNNYDACIQQIGRDFWEWNYYFYQSYLLSGYFNRYSSPLINNTVHTMKNSSTNTSAIQNTSSININNTTLNNTNTTATLHNVPFHMRTPANTAVYANNDRLVWDEDISGYIPLDMKYPRLQCLHIEEFQNVLRMNFMTDIQPLQSILSLSSSSYSNSYSYNNGKSIIPNESSLTHNDTKQIILDDKIIHSNNSNNNNIDSNNNKEDEKEDEEEEEDEDMFDISEQAPTLSFMWQTASMRDHPFNTGNIFRTTAAATTAPIYKMRLATPFHDYEINDNNHNDSNNLTHRSSIESDCNIENIRDALDSSPRYNNSYSSSHSPSLSSRVHHYLSINNDNFIDDCYSAEDVSNFSQHSNRNHTHNMMMTADYMNPSSRSGLHTSRSNTATVNGVTATVNDMDINCIQSKSWSFTSLPSSSHNTYNTHININTNTNTSGVPHISSISPTIIVTAADDEDDIHNDNNHNNILHTHDMTTYESLLSSLESIINTRHHCTPRHIVSMPTSRSQSGGSTSPLVRPPSLSSVYSPQISPFSAVVPINNHPINSIAHESGGSLSPTKVTLGIASPMATSTSTSTSRIQTASNVSSGHHGSPRPHLQSSAVLPVSVPVTPSQSFLQSLYSFATTPAKSPVYTTTTTTAPANVVSSSYKPIILTGRDNGELKPYLPDRAATLNVFNQIQILTNSSLQISKIYLLLSLWLQTFTPLPTQYAHLIKKKSYASKYALSHGFPSSEEMTKFLLYMQDLCSLYALIQICEPYLSLCCTFHTHAVSTLPMTNNFLTGNASPTRELKMKSKYLNSINNSLNSTDSMNIRICNFNKLQVYIDCEPVKNHIKSSISHTTVVTATAEKSDMKKTTSPLTLDTNISITNHNGSVHSNDSRPYFKQLLSLDNSLVHQWSEAETLDYLQKYHMHVDLDIMLAGCSAMSYHECVQCILSVTQHDLELQQGIEVLNRLFHVIPTSHSTAASSTSNINKENNHSKNMIVPINSITNNIHTNINSISNMNMYNDLYNHYYEYNRTFLSSMQLTLDTVICQLAEVLSLSADFHLLCCLIATYVPTLLQLSHNQFILSNQTIISQSLQSCTDSSAASVTAAGCVNALKNNKRQYDRINHVMTEMLLFVYPYIRPQTVKYIMTATPQSSKSSVHHRRHYESNFYQQNQHSSLRAPFVQHNLSNEYDEDDDAPASCIDLYDDILHYTHLLSTLGSSLFDQLYKEATTSTSKLSNLPSQNKDDNNNNSSCSSYLSANNPIWNSLIIQSYTSTTPTTRAIISNSYSNNSNDGHANQSTDTHNHNHTNNLKPSDNYDMQSITATSAYNKISYLVKCQCSQLMALLPLSFTCTADLHQDINTNSHNIKNMSDNKTRSSDVNISHLKVYYQYLTELFTSQTNDMTSHNDNNNNNNSATINHINRSGVAQSQSIVKNTELLCDLNIMSLYFSNSNKYAEYISMGLLLVIYLRSNKMQTSDGYENYMSNNNIVNDDYNENKVDGTNNTISGSSSNWNNLITHTDKIIEYCTMNVTCQCHSLHNTSHEQQPSFHGFHCCQSCHCYIIRAELPVVLSTLVNMILHTMIQIHTPLYFSYYSFYNAKYSQTVDSVDAVTNQQTVLLSLSNILRQSFQLLYTIIQIMTFYEDGHKFGSSTSSSHSKSPTKTTYKQSSGATTGQHISSCTNSISTRSSVYTSKNIYTNVCQHLIDIVFHNINEEMKKLNNEYDSCMLSSTLVNMDTDKKQNRDETIQNTYKETFIDLIRTLSHLS